jgi:VWFA-related protein
MTARTTCFPWVALMVLVALPLLLQEVSARAAPADKSVFVSVLDQSGKPVKNMTMEEFLVREDGTDREIVAVRPATQPLTIELLADSTGGIDEYLQDIRKALTTFVRTVHAGVPDSPIQLMEFGQAARPIAPFSTATEDLEKAINRLSGKRGSGSVLLEAIARAGNELSKRPSPRRAIVVLNLEPSDEQSSEDPKRLMQALQKAGAQVWVVSLQKGALKNPQRDVLLGQITKTTGGRREFLVNQAAVENLLADYAHALVAQYEIVYKRPDTNKPPLQVQIGTRRGNVSLHANAFAPQ